MLYLSSLLLESQELMYIQIYLFAGYYYYSYKTHKVKIKINTIIHLITNYAKLERIE